MPCYHPIPAYQAGPGAKLRLHPPVGFESLSVPCGRCVGCRSARAAGWARRCVHEASLYDHNSFLTLTYDDEHLPVDGTLEPDAFTCFVKRLRKRVASGGSGLLSDLSRGVRFFGCGEYGDKGGRPHYHLLLFNCGFSDGVSGAKKDLFESAALSDLWSLGNASYGTCTGASACYIAKYSMKDVSRRYCTEDGVALQRPFLRMSLKPGIGMPWLDRFADDLRNGYLVDDGSQVAIPRAYKQRLGRDVSPVSDAIAYAEARRRVALGHEHSKPERLHAGEVIATQRCVVPRDSL